jgi:3-hydroxy-9,10-secoandrosta-1,3,5(10)-triene-9,17-dione monooxygenase reductase component
VSDIIDDDTTGFDGARFRQVLGHFPTGGTIIAAAPAGAPVGMAVSSFTSLSLEPPQVLFCAGNNSTSWPKIREHGSFSVNILAEEQEHVSRVFATKAPDKFAEIGWRRARSGNPLIDGCLAFVECRIAQVVESGDHVIVIGDVDDLEVAHEGRPLVFFRGGYGRVEL